MEVPRNLFLQLLVQPALKLSHLAATQARHVNVISRPVRLVVMPVAAQMQQIQLINQSLFFEKINRSVDGNEVHARIDFLRPRQNLIYVQMLLRGIHHLQNDTPLPRHAYATRSHSLLNPTSCLCSIEALTRGNSVRR